MDDKDDKPQYGPYEPYGYVPPPGYYPPPQPQSYGSYEYGYKPKGYDHPTPARAARYDEDRRR